VSFHGKLLNNQMVMEMFIDLAGQSGVIFYLMYGI